jgi:threonine/homoserine/homoserine lactone efflux protein
MTGIACGFAVMMLALGMGLGQLFRRVPLLYTVMDVLSVGYLLYLAWKIATAGAPRVREDTQRKPMTWLQAALFQWINPKAWVMALTGATTFRLHEDPRISALMLALAFGLVNLPSVGVWAAFGTALRRALHKPRLLIAFNWSMAALLVLSMLPTMTSLAHLASHG